MIEEIEHEGKLLAILLRASYEKDGVNFITPKENPLQVGVIKHEQGASIRPHVHRNFPKVVNQVQEVLFIVYGVVETGFYDKNGQMVKSTILKSGDTILLVSGGHGFNVLKECKIIEVKQGPYYGLDEDKLRLNIEERGGE